MARLIRVSDEVYLNLIAKRNGDRDSFDKVLRRLLGLKVIKPATFHYAFHVLEVGQSCLIPCEIRTPSMTRAIAALTKHKKVTEKEFRYTRLAHGLRVFRVR
jgi:predicted CopG family antitoxin